jgi:hypothetical protein
MRQAENPLLRRLKGYFRAKRGKSQQKNGCRGGAVLTCQAEKVNFFGNCLKIFALAARLSL